MSPKILTWDTGCLEVGAVRGSRLSSSVVPAKWKTAMRRQLFRGRHASTAPEFRFATLWERSALQVLECLVCLRWLLRFCRGLLLGRGILIRRAGGWL